MLSLNLAEPGPTRLAYDCKYFYSDRPCKFHKLHGVVCQCEYYAETESRLLIVKLDAMGDVLRTTAMLPPLAKQYPGARIDWITRPESLPLLANNPFIHSAIGYGTDALVRLQTTTYDHVINLDSNQLSASLASMARGTHWHGFVLNESGNVVGTNAAAHRWLLMGVNDTVKRANRTETYQQFMLDILGLDREGHRYVLELTAQEQEFAQSTFDRIGIDRSRPVVGLNVGAGGRWQLKKWRPQGFAELCEDLHGRGIQIVLLGGPSDVVEIGELLALLKVPVFQPGTNHPLRHFAALVDRCDLVVTGDTLAMHIALARSRRVVVLFGPTSSAEIYLYNLGESVVPDMTCLCCYKSECDFQPNCMDLISTTMVRDAVLRNLPK